MKSAVRISGKLLVKLTFLRWIQIEYSILFAALQWADILVLYAMFEMQDYLTQVWGLSYTHAAGILNIWNGISLLLQPLFLYAVCTFLGNFRMLVLSSSSYTLVRNSVTPKKPQINWSWIALINCFQLLLFI